MLNSKFAPVIALTVLAIILIAVLGWFFAIKPQLDEAAVVRENAQEVRDNVVLIEASSARLDETRSILDSLPDLTPSLELNAGDGWDAWAFRERLSASVIDSGMEIHGYEQGGETSVEGWERDPATLVSTQLASLFTTGPVHNEGDTEYEPPVNTEGQAAASTEGITAIPLSFTVIGTHSEMVEFFALMEDPEDPLFQMFEVAHTARPESAAAMAGISDPNDGDQILDVMGYFYMLDADPTISDEEELVPVTLGEESPFEEIEDAPEQPGTGGTGGGTDETED